MHYIIHYLQAERYKGSKKTQKLQSFLGKHKNTKIINAKIENIKKGLLTAIPTDERFFETYALSEGKASATAG